MVSDSIVRLRGLHLVMAGVALISLGALCNTAIIGYLFAPSGSIEDPVRIMEIKTFQFFVIGLGLVVLVCARPLTFTLNRSPRLLAMVLGVVFCVVIWGEMEVLFKRLGRGAGALRVVRNLDTDKTKAISDETLGFGPTPRSRVMGRLTVGDRVVYDVVYEHDELGRRITPGRGATPSDFALFFGGSVTYGEGVHADETMPYYFAGHKEGLRAINYGYSGYGPQAMLAVMEDETRSTALVRELEFSAGDVQGCRCAIYTLIDAHVFRAVGSLRTMVWGATFPVLHRFEYSS